MEPNAPKRIALDARWVFRELSGIGRYTLELLRQWGEIGGAFHFLVIVADAERQTFIAREHTWRTNPAEFSTCPTKFAPRTIRAARCPPPQHRRLPLPSFMGPSPPSRRRPHAIRGICNIHDLIPRPPEFTRALKNSPLSLPRPLHEIARRGTS